MVINTDHLDGEMDSDQRQIAEHFNDQGADEVFVYSMTVEAEFRIQKDGSNEPVEIRDAIPEGWEIKSVHLAEFRSMIYVGKEAL